MSIRLNKKIVSLKIIEENLEKIKKHTKNNRILLPVKADAYGHGLLEVVKYFKNSKLVDYYGVATIDEAMQIRNHNIEKNVLLFGTPTDSDLEKAVALQIEPTISTIENHNYYNKLVEIYRGHLPPAHIKIDTGMGRNGFKPNELENILDNINYKVSGVYTHFATADEYEMSYFLHQKSTFFGLVTKLRKLLPENVIYHSANSSSLLKDDSTHLDMVRPGLLSYGYYPADFLRDFIDVKPALKLTTTIVGIKELSKGDSVSYGATWKAKKKSKIAILPIGYGDGFFRSLGNCGKAIVNGDVVNIVGRICMDQMMIDVTSLEDVKIGDEVSLIDGEIDEQISVEYISSQTNSIPYEITTHLKNSRLTVKYI